MEERWVDVPGYEGIYKISSEGRLKKRWYILTRQMPWGTQQFKVPTKYVKASVGAKGYLKVTLIKEGVPPKQFWLHRLVALAFLGEPPNPRMVAMHKNDDPADPRLTNVKWGTYKDNTQDASKKGRLRKGAQINTAVLTEKKVIKIISLLKQDASMEASRRYADRFGCAVSTVRDIHYRRSWKHVAR